MKSPFEDEYVKSEHGSGSEEDGIGYASNAAHDIHTSIFDSNDADFSQALPDPFNPTPMNNVSMGSSTASTASARGSADFSYPRSASFSLASLPAPIPYNQYNKFEQTNDPSRSILRQDAIYEASMSLAAEVNNSFKPIAHLVSPRVLSSIQRLMDSLSMDLQDRMRSNPGSILIQPVPYPIPVPVAPRPKRQGSEVDDGRESATVNLMNTLTSHYMPQ
jgi:hypothetical protein